MRALLLLLCSVALFGCELVADFDRSKLVQPDAGNTGGVGGSIVPDGGSPDAVIPMPDDDAGDDDAG